MSCDAHVHVFGPASRFPYAEDRTFTPSEAPLEALQDLHAHLGFDRAVIVQSSCHGSDHRILLDALDRGAGRYRGVALVSSRTSAGELTELDAAGVRGARLHFMSHLGQSPDEIEIVQVASRVAELGWVVEVHVSGTGILAFEKVVDRVPATVVVDHMGRVGLSRGISTPEVDAMLRLLDSGRVWVKLSGTDRISLTGPPFHDAGELARRFLTHAPERVVWGTDFPHPNIVGAAPDDGVLLNLLDEVAPDPAALRRLLVSNPAELFDFPHVL